MTDYSPYFDLVEETLTEIENWFSGLSSVLPTLLARFSTEFSMITPSAKVLDIDGMEELFEQLRGTRPGLVITLSEFKGIALYDQGAVIIENSFEKRASSVGSTLERPLNQFSISVSVSSTRSK